MACRPRNVFNVSFHAEKVWSTWHMHRLGTVNTTTVGICHNQRENQSHSWERPKALSVEYIKLHDCGPVSVPACQRDYTTCLWVKLPTTTSHRESCHITPGYWNPTVRLEHVDCAADALKSVVHWGRRWAAQLPFASHFLSKYMQCDVCGSYKLAYVRCVRALCSPSVCVVVF